VRRAVHIYKDSGSVAPSSMIVHRRVVEHADGSRRRSSHQNLASVQQGRTSSH